MRKKILVLALTAILTLTSVGLATADNNSDTIKVKIDNQALNLTDKPVIVEGRTMLPVRAIAEALDCEVAYEPVTKVVTITKDGMEPIHIIIGNEGSFISPEGRTYVPLRYIAEKFGAEVEWNGDSRTVEITTTISEGVSGVVEEPKADEPAADEKEEPVTKEITFDSIVKGGDTKLPTEDGRGILETEIVTKNSFPLEIGNFIVKDIGLMNTGLNSPYGDEYIGITCESLIGDGITQGNSQIRMLLVDQDGFGRYRSASGFDKGIGKIFKKEFPLAKGEDGTTTAVTIGEVFTNIYAVTNGGFDWDFDKDGWKFKAEKIKYIGLYDYTKNKIFFIENPLK